MGDSYGGRGTTNATEEKEKHRRKGTAVVWSSDSTKFAMVRSDMRKVADLWVVHAVGNDRCAAQPAACTAEHHCTAVSQMHDGHAT